MPCINSTSFLERGGRDAVVDNGNDLVGWPGAPGWTTTCPEIESEKKNSDAARMISERSLLHTLNEKECMGLSGLALKHKLSQNKQRYEPPVFTGLFRGHCSLLIYRWTWTKHRRISPRFCNAAANLLENKWVGEKLKRESCGNSSARSRTGILSKPFPSNVTDNALVASAVLIPAQQHSMDIRVERSLAGLDRVQMSVEVLPEKL